MKIAIRILYGLLLVALLLTTLGLLRRVLPSYPGENIDPDIEKYRFLATLVILIYYIYAVFLEIEAFIGLRYILLGVEKKSVFVIVFSALLLFSVLAIVILGISEDKYSSMLGIDFTAWFLATLVEIIVLDVILIVSGLLVRHKRICKQVGK